MTARRRSAHGIFKARQNNPRAPTPSLPFVPGFQPTTTGLSSSSQVSTTTTPLLPPGTSSAPTTLSSTQATSTSSGTTQTSTPTSTPASTSVSTSSSTSSPTLSSISTSTTLRASTTPAQQPAYSQHSYTTYTYAGLTSSSSAPSATSSSSSSSTTGSMSIGSIVGIVAGGFFGIIFVLILGSYIMRWYRRHSAERDFTDEYNEPTPEPTFAAAGGRTKEDVFGPQMSQRTSSPSLGGGAGMAGQGVMASRAIPARGYGGGYGSYGGYPNVDEEIISGAYSSQPQPQIPYNAEAYGAYGAYNAASGYQEALRGYQGQRAFEQPINYGYAISEDPMPMQPAPASPPPAPAPSTSPRPIPTSPRTTPSAALAAVHAAAAVHAPASAPALQDAQDGQRKSAMYTEDDAYAGF